MTSFVSLFRGINIGGNHKVKMDELRDLHVSLGLHDVLSYIQSGNVVFKSDNTDAAQLRQQIEDSFEKKFGFHANVLVRTAPELQAIIANNPFQDQQSKESNWIVVLFLAASPDSSAQTEILKYDGPEELFIIGKELHIYYPDGIGRSKLSHSFIEKTLKTSGTARNWNTVHKLHEMMQQ